MDSGRLVVAAARMAPAVDSAGSAVSGKLLPALSDAAGALGRALQSASGPDVMRFVDGLTASLGGLAGEVGHALGGAGGNDAQAAAVGAAVLLLALSPQLAKAASSGLRGYTGNVPAPLAAEELLSSTSLLVDIRADPSAGIPEVKAGRMKAKYVAIPLQPVSDQGVRVGDAMSGMAALKISALKPKYLSGGKKGTRVYVLDDSGRDAPAVAKKLTGTFGVKTVYVISGGFRGRQGWTDCGLPVREGSARGGVISSIGTQFARE